MGDKDFSKEVTTITLDPKWDSVWDASKGELPAREAIIDFDLQLKKIGVDLIVVPVPSKIEAYARLFEAETAPGLPISLGRLSEMLYLLDHDVEVIDPLPTILSLMTEDDETPLYEKTMHHPSGLAVRHLGELVAERLERYDFRGRDLTRFSEIEHLAQDRSIPVVPMRLWEVRMDGRPYEHVPDSPVIVVGDSNVYVHGRASWASHIARASGIPITDVSRSAGGHDAYARLASQGLAKLKKREVVVCILSATSMERRPWRAVKIPRKASGGF